MTAAFLIMSLAVPLAASASIGASSSPLSTAAPDLRTAAVENVAADRVRFCFDQPVANFGGNQSNFHLVGYNDSQVASGTSIGADTNPNCVLVEFGTSRSAITQYTVATTDPTAVWNAAVTNANIEGATALTGITLGAGGIGGKTTTADLTGAVLAATNSVDYTYDEVLDETYAVGVGCAAGLFGLWDNTGARFIALSCTHTPGTAVVRANFASTANAVRFFSLNGAVADRGGDGGNGAEVSPTSSTTPSIDCDTGPATDNCTADLSSASRVSPTTVSYTFDLGDPTPGNIVCSPGNFTVYEEDGTTSFGGSCTVTSSTLTSTVVEVTGYSPSTTNYSAFETPSAAVTDGALSGTEYNTDGARPLGTSKEASGFTDGPDLESASFDNAFNRVTYSFDENVDPATIVVPAFRVVDNDDSESNSSGLVSSNNNQVVMAFSPSEINTAVGALVTNNAVEDYAANISPQAAVGQGPPPTPGSVQFSSSSASVGEAAGACPGGGAQLPVTRTGGSSGAASVNYATANGSAAAGSDYTNTSGTLNWASGDSASKTICVPILQDTLAESAETFTVTLSGASGASQGSPSVNTVTINDDDAGTGALSFSSATYSTSEAANATITVNRTGGSTGTVTVNYATSNGTATAGTDYTATSGTLTFGPSVTSQSFTVPVTNDTVDENDETVNVTLSSPGGGATLGSPSSAVLTIVDNDTAAPGTIALSSSTYSVNESAGTATVTATRTGGSDGSVSVQYSVTSGTATAGTDFTATSGTLTFVNGDVSESFSVPITNDTLDEPDETANVTLSSPGGGATLGSPSSATLTIVDDDVPAQASVRSRITLLYRPSADRFKGKVSTVGGTSEQSSLCRAGRTVQLKKNGRTIGSTLTASSGRWTIGGLPDPKGRHQAIVKKRVVSLSNGGTLVCKRARSNTLNF
jgi:hypothetical protein